jgi:hypothetical protein
MATATSDSLVLQIGETAGVVWKTLNDHGPMTLAKLVKAVGVPRDLTMQAIGWLAREDKIQIDEDRRSRILSLREPG